MGLRKVAHLRETSVQKKKYGGKCSKQNNITICSVMIELAQETQIMQRERDRSRAEETERERQKVGVGFKDKN